MRADPPHGADTPRLGDVAHRAGVSRATASKALNGRKDVSPETRTRVLAAATDLGYQRRTSVEKPSYPIIAMVTDDLTAAYTLDILRGAVTSAMSAGVALVSLYTPSVQLPGMNVPLTDAWFETVKAQDWVGVIAVTVRLSPRQLSKAAAINLQLVAIDAASALPPQIASIGATNWNGGVDATQHLLDLGHERIAFIGGTKGSVPAAERLQGYISALGMRGMSPNPHLVKGEEFSLAAGKKAAFELFDLPPSERPTAVFASSDTIALGVYEAAHERGITIPDQLSVVGFDDTAIAEITIPRLTTVRQPLEDMGAAAVRYLMDVRKGRPTTSGPLRLATRLVVRSSTAAPNTFEK